MRHIRDKEKRWIAKGKAQDYTLLAVGCPHDLTIPARYDQTDADNGPY
jgi:hypothetical protein